MSSPAASASGGDSHGEKKPLEQITFRFCSECSNLLYPKEDENEHKLMFTCRTCKFSEEATSSCIYRNVLNNAVGETAGVTQDVGSDPTVGTNFIIPSEGMCEDGDSTASAYVCCLCCGALIVCEVCGDRLAILPSDGGTHDPDEDECQLAGFDSEEEDIRVWSMDNDEDLSSFMARTSGFFGSWTDQLEDEEMGMDDEPNDGGPGTIGYGHESLVALAPGLAH
jgi:DNA-directed RNA polymerase II subunit RPB9